MINIEPLTYETLEDSINLVNKSFPNENIITKLQTYIAFHASLAIPKKGLKSKFYKNLLRIKGVSELRYWIAKDNNKLVGVTGLYTNKKDEGEAIWIGWTCVDSDERRKGIGKSLYDLVLNEAKKNNKKYLRVYTSTDKNENIANKIYDKLDFETFKIEDNILYKQLKLF